ncbi:uncharacterized protein LOC141616815 isoform X1 [Silene latifolia]|uniref:uncharacterized protein LOC141616815 isoform X1 n=1 Tax=Silene latifolia TaxID=37657 RepID=UPI003D78206D
MIPLNINVTTPIHLPFLVPRSSPILPSLSLSNVKSTSGRHVQRGRGLCRVELNPDASITIAIGASMLNTYFFGHPTADVEDAADDDDSAVSSTDARFAVMTIISVIPYFNWLSWVFALMDTGKRRYAVYALVYLAPYIRTNFALSPDENWLPIASIVLCIIHIQLEASIRNGDLESFNFFNEIWKRLGFINLKKDKKDSQPRNLRKRLEEQRRQDNLNLPLGRYPSMDEMGDWNVPRPSEDVEHVKEDTDLDDGKKH